MLPFFRFLELVNRMSLLKVSLEQISTSVHVDFLPALPFTFAFFFNNNTFSSADLIPIHPMEEEDQRDQKCWHVGVKELG